MKNKKLISIILTFCMLLSLLTAAPVMAEESVMISSAADLGMPDPNWTKAAVAGINGKAAEDEIYKFTGTTNQVWTYTTVAPSNSSLAYVVFEANILPADNIDAFQFCTNGGAGISTSTTLEKNKWTKIVSVLDKSTYVVTTYVNGKSLEKTNTTSYSNGNTQIRFVATASTSGETAQSMYMDDVRVYETGTAPTSATLAQGTLPSCDSYLVSGSVIIPEGELTVADIAATTSGNTVRVYSSDYTQKTDGAVNDNDIVVVENTNGLNYYTVDSSYAGIKKYLISSAADLEMPDGNWTKTAVEGIKGKAVTDEIYKFTGTTNQVWPYKAVVPADSALAYVVFEANILPADNIDTFNFTTNGGWITNEVPLEGNKWTKIVGVMEKSTRMVTTYVNGEVYGSSAVTNYSSGSYNQIRFMAQAKTAGTSAQTAYMDDVAVYETDIAPAAQQLAPGTVATSDKYQVAGMIIVPKSELTVADIAAATSSDSVRVYSSDYTQKTEGAVNDSDIVVVESVKGINYYTVDSSYAGAKSSMLQFASSADNSAFSDGVSSKEWVKGIGGKSADDESCKMTGDTTQIWCYTTKVLSNADMPYVIFEANILTTGNVKTFKISTRWDHEITSESEMVPNQWNKIVGVMDKETRNVTTYINGEYIKDITTDYTSSSDYQQIRLSAKSTESDGNQYIYVDDVYVYETDIKPVVSSNGSAVAEDVSKGVIVSGSKVYASAAPDGYSVLNLTSDVYNGYTGTKLVNADSNNNFKSYDFCNYGTGSVNFICVTYDELKNLKSVDYCTVTNGAASKNMEIPEGATVMIWESFESCKPVFAEFVHE